MGLSVLANDGGHRAAAGDVLHPETRTAAPRVSLCSRRLGCNMLEPEDADCPDLDFEGDDPVGVDCDVCWDSGEVPTADFESYLGAQMKPCPKCHGKLEGLGHGRLS